MENEIKQVKKAPPRPMPPRPVPPKKVEPKEEDNKIDNENKIAAENESGINTNVELENSEALSDNFSKPEESMTAVEAAPKEAKNKQEKKIKNKDFSYAILYDKRYIEDIVLPDSFHK